MHTDGPPHDPHHELLGALRRAERRRATASPRPSDLLKFIAILGIGLGLSLDRIGPAFLLTTVGAAALWLCFTHDDGVIERKVAARLDPLTGLPSVDDLATVLDDDLVVCSVTGRIAIVAVHVPTITSTRFPQDATVVATSISGRLRSRRWAGSGAGPYDPLVFIARPGIFLVILRDVIDDHTTWWLVRRLHDVVDEPITAVDSTLDPRAVVSVAVGDASIWRDLTQGAVASALGHVAPPVIDLDAGGVDTVLVARMDDRAGHGPDDHVSPGPSDSAFVDTRRAASRSAHIAKAVSRPFR